MNIPRQFYGINYLSRILGNFQDGESIECPKLAYHAIEDVTPIPLKTKPTAAISLNAQLISAFLQEIFTDRSCALDGLGICRGENLVFASYRPPYSDRNPHITNSTCKTVVAIAAMFAISEHLLLEDDPVLSFFPEYDTLLTPKYVKRMTVYHLLTMTSCSKCNEAVSVTEKDWIKAFLLSDCQQEPGSKFIYNSMNTYMLAVILTKVTGMSLMDYLKERFFVPLGINHAKWELCPQGIERGGWGLHISIEGMCKIGLFLANDGAFGKKQLLNASYIRKMKDTKVFQDVDRLSTGYGYQLWHLPHGLYMLSGMYGQHVIIDEKHKLVVATNAHNDKMFPDSVLVSKIIALMTDKKLYEPAAALQENIHYKRLLQQVDAFSHGYDLRKYSAKIPYTAYHFTMLKQHKQEIARLSELLHIFEGKRLHVDQATFKLFPYMLQGMYQCPPFHVTDIAFRKTESTWKLCLYKEKSKKETEKIREKMIIEAGLDEYYHQNIMLGEEEKEIAVKAYPAMDEDGHDVVFVEIVFPDAGFSRVIKFFLLEDRIGIECLEYPDMRGIVEQVLYGETLLAGTKIDLTDKLPQSVRLFLEHEVEPRVHGYFR
ncbi:MAG: beta-lactamase family protein [Lachnospiraceae bacterium]|nr:beta-lactamase family protein [Lachnospiraceae bacterium]